MHFTCLIWKNRKDVMFFPWKYVRPIYVRVWPICQWIFPAYQVLYPLNLILKLINFSFLEEKEMNVRKQNFETHQSFLCSSVSISTSSLSVWNLIFKKYFLSPQTWILTLLHCSFLFPHKILGIFLLPVECVLGIHQDNASAFHLFSSSSSLSVG